MAKASKSQILATNTYNEEHYERIGIRIKKGQKDIWLKRANELNMSMAAYLSSLVEADLNKQNPLE